MPKFTNLASVTPIAAEGNAEDGFTPVFSATLEPATVPTTTLVFDGTTVLTNDIELVAANPNRVSLRLQNLSASTTVWLNFNDEPAIANASYRLLAGQEFVYTSSSNGRFTGNVHAVVQSGSADVFYIQEVTA